MRNFDRIQLPTFLVDSNKAGQNIRRMAQKAKKAGLVFRPHFKTHQSATVGEWYRSAGTEAITVSSFSMAGYFARNGWKDITVALPVNIRELDTINHLAREIRLNLLVESIQIVEFLSEHLESPAGCWIKADTGYRRTGIDWRNQNKFIDLATAIVESDRLNFCGLLSHFGHTYHSESVAHTKQIYVESMNRLEEIRSALEAVGLPRPLISVGDTPSCSVVENFAGADEIRPGNFVFYDAMQLHLGACRVDEIAVAMACPVVAVHPQRSQIVIYGGAVHFSKDSFSDGTGQVVFGQVCGFGEAGWGNPVPGARLISLSQEHGVVQAPADLIEKTRPGDLLYIIPAHSCLAINRMTNPRTLDGEKLDLMPGQN